MNTVQTITPILQLVLSFGNVCILLFAFVKFLSKPHNSLDERVTELEKWKVDVNRSLALGNAQFEYYDITNEIIIKSIIALIEFEMDYCSTEHKPVSKNLERAKDELHDYLAQKRRPGR